MQIDLGGVDQRLKQSREAQAARAWQGALVISRKMLQSLSLRAEPKTAAELQNVLYKYLEVDLQSHRPKNVPPGDAAAALDFVRKVTQRVKHLVSESRVAVQSGRGVASLLLDYRVGEVFIVLSSMVQTLAAEFVEDSPPEKALQGLARSLNKQIRDVGDRVFGRPMAPETFDLLAQTGKLPGLAEYRDELRRTVASYFGQSSDFGGAVRALCSIAEDNLVSPAGEALLWAIRYRISDEPAFSPSEKVFVTAVIADTRARIRTRIIDYVRQLGSKSQPVPYILIPVVECNLVSLLNGQNGVSFAQLGLDKQIRTTIGAAFYAELSPGEMKYVQVLIGNAAEEALDCFLREPRIRRIYTLSPLEMANDIGFVPASMPTLLRILVESHIPEAVSALFPAVAQHFAKGQKWEQLVCAVFALRYWAERPQSISGVRCYNVESAIARPIIDGLQLFLKTQDHKSDLELLTRLACKAEIVEAAQAITMLLEEMSIDVVRQVVALYVHSDHHTGSDLLNLGVAVSEMSTFVGWDAELPKIRSFSRLFAIARGS